MIFFVFALLVICLYGITIYQKPDFCRDYLSKTNTMSVRGLFVLLVIASHFKQYVELTGSYDTMYKRLSGYLSQTVIVMFLFYSGYGIYESIKAKGSGYVKAMPVRRILVTFVNLALALFCFLFVNRLLGISYDRRTILLAFTGWKTIGNSNWYIFAMMFLYIVTWLSFTVFRKHPVAAISAVTLFCGLYMVRLYAIYPKQGWWYNTIFCYAFGMWYSFFKDDIERLLFTPPPVLRRFVSYSPQFSGFASPCREHSYL
ncbi:MAG: hypothetical protein Q4C50_08565 [Eubacteriales bacterium]|nr:hypothetical protein [Eubacteriales bacterium]